MSFERWFDKFIQNKMAVPALAFAGIAGGLATIEAAVLSASHLGNAIAGVGFALIASSATVFILYLARRLNNE